MEFNKLGPKQWYIQQHEIQWKIADFAKLRTNRKALELQHFYFKMGTSIDIASKWKCFLKFERKDQLDVLRPDVKLDGDIPENADFVTTMLIKIKNGTEFLCFKLDTYQTEQVSIMDYVGNLDHLSEHDLNPDGSLTLTVNVGICNRQKIQQNISENALMVSVLTWVYEYKFIKKFKENFQTMYRQGFGDGQSLGVKLITKDGREFLANRAILGVRSPVFRSMFETHEGVIKIDDISGPAFDALLSFMYTGKLPGNLKEPEVLEGLIYGAFKYMLEDLQKFFRRILVFLCSDGEDEGVKQNFKQLADMLNIKLDEDWNACLENFIKEDYGRGHAVLLEHLKLMELEPRLLIALVGHVLQ